MVGIAVISQIKDIWRYRELTRELVATWLRLRHAGSILGVLWTLLHPIVLITIYWVVFTQVLRVDIPNYALMLIPGFLAWSFTNNAIGSSGESIIEGKYLITKIAFPNEVIVLASVSVAFVDYIAAICVFLFAFIVLSGLPSASILWLLPILLLHLAFTLGVSLLVACSAVFFRDIPKLIPLIMTALFFVTPIFYTLEMVPQPLREVALLNPLTWIVTLYHDVFYRQTTPDLSKWGVVVAMSCVTLVAGLAVFGKVKHSFAELS